MDQNSQNYQSAADLDNLSLISPLQCGSILPNPEYDPSRDPINVAFVPPLEIFVKGKVEIPEWLRPGSTSECRENHLTLNRVSSAPSDRNAPHGDLSRQISWDSRLLELREPMDTNDAPSMALHGIHRPIQKPSHERCAKSTNSAGTLNTSATTDVSFEEDTESLGLEVVPERSGIDTKLHVGRFTIFRRRRRNVSLRRSRGCLT